MSNYHKNKAAARTRNTDPTLTDQSQAADTDINVIVRRHQAGGFTQPGRREPIYADFAALPRGLREMIEHARTLPRIREQLPEGLRDLPVETLVNLTPNDVTRILTPPADPQPDPPNGEIE